VPPTTPPETLRFWETPMHPAASNNERTKGLAGAMGGTIARERSRPFYLSKPAMIG
jgi:hypothetical protein